MKILSIDAETNGLWGAAFSIGAVLMQDGKMIDKFVVRCPIAGAVNEWVEANVLPQMRGIPETHPDYKSMLQAFIAYYMENKTDAHIIVHMGLPVEAKLFLDAHMMGILGDWDAPYPLLDISAFPEIGTSVDTYNQMHGLCCPTFDGGTHNPLYDAYAAAVAYDNLVNSSSNR